MLITVFLHSCPGVLGLLPTCTKTGAHLHRIGKLSVLVHINTREEVLAELQGDTEILFRAYLQLPAPGQTLSQMTLPIARRQESVPFYRYENNLSKVHICLELQASIHQARMQAHVSCILVYGQGHYRSQPQRILGNSRSFTITEIHRGNQL